MLITHDPILPAPPQTHLGVGLAALSDGSYPGQHVVPVLGLQQVLTEVLRGEAEGVLPLGLAVGDVHQAARQADGWLVVLAGRPGAVEHRLPLVLVEEQRMGAQDGEDALPRPHAAAQFLVPRGKHDT